MAKYRKKPVVIDAFLWTGGKDQKEDPEWIVDALEQGEVEITHRCTSDYKHEALIIKTLEGTMTASPGDYIIKGVQGEIYPCKPDIFEETYELVTSTLAFPNHFKILDVRSIIEKTGLEEGWVKQRAMKAFMAEIGTFDEKGWYMVIPVESALVEGSHVEVPYEGK